MAPMSEHEHLEPATDVTFEIILIFLRNVYFVKHQLYIIII